jgi:hypothetical protein
MGTEMSPDHQRATEGVLIVNAKAYGALFTMFIKMLQKGNADGNRDWT